MLFNKWNKYSYTDQMQYKSKARNLALKVLLLIGVYILLTNIFFPMMIMESRSMQPTVLPGDRIVFSALNIRKFLSERDLTDDSPFERGSVVMIDRSRGGGGGFGSELLDRVFRFFTAGKAGLPGKKNDVYMKRIIGLPGDKISIINYVVQVQSAGNPYTLTEYELSEYDYNIAIPQVSSLWDESLPFSGGMDTITLEDDECFVLSDDRTNTNDSRTWGAVNIKSITGKALFRYWPPNRFGRL